MHCTYNGPNWCWFALFPFRTRNAIMCAMCLWRENFVYEKHTIAQPKTTVTPVLPHWSYHSLGLSHRYKDIPFLNKLFGLIYAKPSARLTWNPRTALVLPGGPVSGACGRPAGCLLRHSQGTPHNTATRRKWLLLFTRHTTAADISLAYKREHFSNVFTRRKLWRKLLIRDGKLKHRLPHKPWAP